MSELHEEYIKHDIFGRTYTLAKGNHICVNIITDTTAVHGHERVDDLEKVWFMEISDGKVVYTGQTCEENNIVEKDVSKFPRSLVEDVEQQYNVTVVSDIDRSDIFVPKNSLEIDIPTNELKNMSVRELSEKLAYNDIKPEDGYKRINEFSNDSYGHTLEDTKTGRKMIIEKYKQTFKIKLFDNNDNKLHTGDSNEYKPSEVGGILDDYRTFLQL